MHAHFSPTVTGVDVHSLAFRADLALLTLAGSQIEDCGSHLVVHTPNNPGYRWGNFYLLARPPHTDEIDQMIATYDADFPHSAHRAFGVLALRACRGKCPPSRFGLSSRTAPARRKWRP